MSRRMSFVLPLLLAAAVATEAGEGQPRASKAARKAVLDEAGKAQAMALFRAKVDQYLALQKREREQIPKLPEKAVPEQIAAYEAQLAARMRAVRKNAPQGEVFSPEVEPLFRQILSAELKGPGNEPTRKTVAEGNPRLESEPDAKPVRVAVNGTYTDAPVATTPASVLARLPPLPDQLAYRFVGRHLTLRDNESGLVVDYLLNVAPPLPTGPARNR